MSGISKVGEQNSIEYKAIQQAPKVETKIDIGAAMLQNEGESYTQATVGASVAIPIGKNSDLNVKAFGAGGDTWTLGGELGLTKHLSNKVAINGGIGIQHHGFDQTRTVEEMEMAGGDAYEINLSGHYMYGTLDEYKETIIQQSKSGETTPYLTAGVEYKPTSKLKLSLGGNAGITKIHGDMNVVQREGTKTTFDTPVTGWLDEYTPMYGKTETTVENYVNMDVEKRESKPFGQVKLGAEYEVAKNVSVGVNANLGTENFVGSKIQIKF